MRLDCLYVYTKLGPHMVSWINASALHHYCGVIELAGSQDVYKWDERPLHPSVFHSVLEPELKLTSVDSIKSLRKLLDLVGDLRPRALLTCRYDLPIIRRMTQAAHRSGAVTLLMSDSWEGDKKRNRVRELVKAAVLRRLFDGAIVSGSRSWAYLRKLGFRPETLWTGIDVVDNEHFRSASPTASAGEHLNLPDSYFLVPCRHAPEKNLLRFISAFGRYRQAGGSWSAVLIGSGPLTPVLMSLAKTLNLASSLVFAGWAPYADLPLYYSRCRVVLLPSISEPWGLVVNEAMAAGKPVLVSTQCGCVPELVRRGVNGYTFDPFNIQELCSLLLRTSSAECDLESMGRNGAEIIRAFTPETRALAIRDCVETLV
jgi:glycosyltransferase involved in cell wall biosynthesis